MAVFAAYGHTPSTRARACGASTKLDLSLRGIKEATSPLFFPQDLLGGQSLNHSHLPLAVGTLPNGGLRSGGWCSGVRRRWCSEQISANRE